MNGTTHCPMCGGSLFHGKTLFGVDLGAGVVVVRDVPANACDQCGEVPIDDEAAERLEAIVGRAREDHAEVVVLMWVDVAA